MVRFALAVCALLAACCVLYGWGMAVRRLTQTQDTQTQDTQTQDTQTQGGSRAVTMALGLAVLLPIGGLLNLVRLATPIALWLILGIGLVFFILHVKTLRMRWPKEAFAQVEVILTVGLIALVVGFAVLTQLPPSAFNYHDDFHKYLAHPVRMLATGTLFGSPLSAIGSETLGGMAFLHAFPLLVAPIEYINGVDAILGLLLLMMLGASAGWGRLAPWPGAILAPLLIAFINPQYVNVSSLFTGAALMAAAVMLTTDDRETSLPSRIVLGLVYAGLVALKPIFILFPLLHLPLVALSVARSTKSWRAGAVWALQAGLSSAAALLPWLLLHAPHYLRSMQPQPDDVVPPAAIIDRLHIFSIDPLVYGTTFAHYSVLLILALGATALAITAWRRPSWRGSDKMPIGIAVAAATLTLAYVTLLAAAPALAGYATSVRYAVPFFLGIAPVIAVLALSIAPDVPVGRLIVLAGFVFCLASFSPALLDRYRQSVRAGSILAFSSYAMRPDYLASNRDALSDASTERMRGFQEMIPEGETMIAWVGTPFHLDFRRNNVLDVEPAGLTTRWAKMPDDARYVLWEYTGFGVPSPDDYVRQSRTLGVRDRLTAVRALRFGQDLLARAQKGTVLHDDGRFIVFKMDN